MEDSYANRCEIVSEELERKVESFSKQLPSKENHMHCALIANITIEDEKYESGAVVVSDHYIILYKSTFTGYSVVKSFHLFNLKQMIVPQDIEEFTINISDLDDNSFTVVIAGENYAQIGHILWRNTYLITSRFPTRKRPALISEDENVFPQIELDISASQAYQFAYHAFCSHNKSYDYDHFYVQQIHHQFKCSNFTLDIGNFHRWNDLVPVVRTVTYAPYFNALICDKFVDVSSIQVLQLFITHHVPISAVQITSISDFNDLGQLSDIMVKYGHKIKAWRITNVKLKNTKKFMRALTKSKTKMHVVDLSNMNMSYKACLILLKGIRKNPNFWHLEMLGIGSCVIDAKIKRRLRKYILTVIQNGIFNLKHIVLSDCGENIGKVSFYLSNSELPIQKVDFSNNNKLSDWTKQQIMQLAAKSKTIQDIDISKTNFHSRDIEQLVTAFAKGKSDGYLKIRLNNIKIQGKIGPILSSLIDTNCEKWEGIEVRYNDFRKVDCNLICSVILMLPNLAYLDLSGNFNSSMSGVGKEMARLLEHPNLKTLLLNGDKKLKLKKEVVPIFEALRTNKTLERFEVRKNDLGNDLIELFGQVLSQNDTLQFFEICDNNVTDLDIISSFVQIVCNRKCSLGMHFFHSDTTYIINGAPSDKSASIARRVYQIECNLIAALCAHRAGTHFAHLPFIQLPMEIENVIIKESQKIEAMPEMKKRNIHTCGTEVFNLPLPYQSIKEHPEANQDVKRIALGDMVVYDTDSIGKIVVEPPYEEDVQINPQEAYAYAHGFKQDDKKDDDDSSSSRTSEKRKKTRKINKKLQYDFETMQVTQEFHKAENAPVLDVNKQTEIDRRKERKRIEKLLKTAAFDINEEPDIDNDSEDHKSNSRSSHHRRRKSHSYQEYDSDEDDDKRKQRKRNQKARNKESDSSDSEEDDRKRSKKTNKRETYDLPSDVSINSRISKRKKIFESSSDDSPKNSKRKTVHFISESSSEDIPKKSVKKRHISSSESSEDVKPVKKSKRKIQSSGSDEKPKRSSKKKLASSSSSSEPIIKRKAKIPSVESSSSENNLYSDSSDESAKKPIKSQGQLKMAPTKYDLKTHDSSSIDPIILKIKSEKKKKKKEPEPVISSSSSSYQESSSSSDGIIRKEDKLGKSRYDRTLSDLPDPRKMHPRIAKKLTNQKSPNGKKLTHNDSDEDPPKSPKSPPKKKISPKKYDSDSDNDSSGSSYAEKLFKSKGKKPKKSSNNEYQDIKPFSTPHLGDLDHKSSKKKINIKKDSDSDDYIIPSPKSNARDEFSPIKPSKKYNLSPRMNDDDLTVPRSPKRISKYRNQYQDDSSDY